MWVLIDNYDSFTYMLHHYLLQLHRDILVIKNDAITISELVEINPSCIIISPGPKRPVDAGIIMDLIAHFIGKIPILGICLGHQALGEYLGAKLIKASAPVHGKTSIVKMKNNFTGFEDLNEFVVMRYHSLILSEYEKIDGFEALGYTVDDDALMLFKHGQLKCFGMQFHPESIGTPKGIELLTAWYVWAFKS